MKITNKTLATVIAIAAGGVSFLSSVGSAQISQAAVSAAQDLVTCVRTLSRDPEYAEISTKLPLQDMNTVSFSMLADQSRPTVQERKEIASWFDARENCWKTSEPTLRALWPPEIVQISNEGSASLKAIGVELYNGKLTYGEANKEIEDLGNSIKARIIPIVKQFQADAAAQQAAEKQQTAQRTEAAERQSAQQQAYADAQANQAQALRQQRAQLFLNFMRANQPSPVQLPPPPRSYITNCATSVNSTNCVTH
jgi:hypothetical protein